MTLRVRDHTKQLGRSRNTYPKGADLASTLYAQQRKRNRLNRGVWKGVINTFMRNGSKLRYQTMLRKALLEL